MIKKLAASIREYLKPALLSPAFVILEVAMEVIIPLLMASLIDKGIDAGDRSYVIKIGAVLIAACLVSLIFGAVAGDYSAKASAGYAKNLRHDMYYKVQDFSFSNIDKFSTASIITRLTTDVTNVQNAFQMIIRVAVRAPIMLIFSLIMAFRINSQLSMIFLAIVPLLAIGLYIIMIKPHPIFERVFNTYDKLNGVVQENLQGIRVVKAYVREGFEKEKFNRISDSIYEDFVKAESIVAFNSPLMQFCVYMCLLLLSWFGARLIVTTAGSPKPVTTGEFTSLISYAMQMLMSLMMLSFVLVMIVISRASAERIVELLNEKSSLTNPENPVFKVEDGSISFRNVSFSYVDDKEKEALKNINLNIKSGDTVGILGGTGASKTTLVQLIPRLYDATEGEVLVGGRNVKEYDLETLRNQVAMVLQKNVLFSGTISENLRWGKRNATDEELVEACKQSQANEFVTSFPKGYDTYLEEGGTNLSGGQKQRLCIARALLMKPKIIILDDSTSAVDTKTDALIRKAFREEIPNTTKLIIAQRISSIQDADMIIILESGTIAATGTHEELLETNSIYRQVFKSQTKGGDADE